MEPRKQSYINLFGSVNGQFGNHMAKPVKDSGKPSAGVTYRIKARTSVPSAC